MTTHFYIADDDRGIRTILKSIIENHHLGTVIGLADNGKTAIDEIIHHQPDIVLIDLLMPQVDGIGVVTALKKQDFTGSFIMISQVDSKEMISGAYQQGIEFFISKPLNVVEVIAVIQNVMEKHRLTKMLHSFESAIQHVRQARPKTAAFPLQDGLEKSSPTDERGHIRRILANLGILGEAGCQDLIEIVYWMNQSDDPTAASGHHSYRLADAYHMLQQFYSERQGICTNPGAIEQRVRRAIKSALKNLANLGIDNYDDDVFIRYSTILYEFGEVRREMDHEKGKSPYGGKISVKKFVEGIQILLTEQY
ncbi:DNA-binding domain-containing protein [Anoxynatronum sibiricum]|uniref:Stage 0 sporulation protein A homolog n=1 Tax=Anoxynatronum sibiricum TaxID=210623 RepID=A0ABU9VPB9_9CLOT